MTAPICGARTWGHEEPVACTNDAGHDGRHGNPAYGSWDETRLYVEMGDSCFRWTIDEARGAVALIQARLDALDPDAAIAEAERVWIAALERAATLDAMLSEVSEGDLYARRRAALVATVKRAAALAEQAEEIWLALVEARDAKGGGA